MLKENERINNSKNIDDILTDLLASLNLIPKNPHFINEKQREHLLEAFNSNPDMNWSQIKELAKKLGFKHLKVSKWIWDHKKKQKL